MSNRFIPDRETPTGSDTPLAQGEHEFGAGDNIVIDSLGTWLRIVGAIMSVFGMLQVVLGLLTFKSGADVISVIQGVLMAIIGGLLVGASRGFKNIVRTRGTDISHLMEALGKLRTAYTIQGVALICVVSLVVVAILLAVGGK